MISTSLEGPSTNRSDIENQIQEAPVASISRNEYSTLNHDDVEKQIQGAPAANVDSNPPSSEARGGQERPSPFEPDQVTFTPFTPGNEHSKDEENIWKIYLEYAQKADNRQAVAWDKDLDNLLIFAGLFSAVVTAFIIESRKGLQEDLQLTTNTLLIYLITSMNGTATDILPPHSTISFPFEPTPSALWINGLWFSSLMCSLSSAGAAMLAKSWIREFNVTERQAKDAKKAAIDRQRRLEATVSWHFALILTWIPLFLHISFFLFVSGMLVLLWADNHTVATCVSIIAGAVALLYLSSTLLPLWHPHCPFRTPTTTFVQQLTSFLKKIPKSAFKFVLQDVIGVKSFTGLLKHWFEQSLAEKAIDLLVRRRDQYAGTLWHPLEGFLFFLMFVVGGLVFLTLPFYVLGRVFYWSSSQVFQMVIKPEKISQASVIILKIFSIRKDPSSSAMEAHCLTWLLEAVEDLTHIAPIFPALARLDLQDWDPRDDAANVLNRLRRYFFSITTEKDSIITGTSDDVTLREFFSALTAVQPHLLKQSAPSLQIPINHMTHALLKFKHPVIQKDALILASSFIQFSWANFGSLFAKDATAMFAARIRDDPHILPVEIAIETLTFPVNNKLSRAYDAAYFDTLLVLLRTRGQDGCNLLSLLNAIYRSLMYLCLDELPPTAQSIDEAMTRLLKGVPLNPRIDKSRARVKVVVNLFRDLALPAPYWSNQDLEKIRPRFLQDAPFDALRFILVSDTGDYTVSEQAIAADALVALGSIQAGVAAGFFVGDFLHIKRWLLVPELVHRMGSRETVTNEMRHHPSTGVPSIIDAIRAGLDAKTNHKPRRPLLLENSIGWINEIREELTAPHFPNSRNSSSLAPTVEFGVSLLASLTQLENDLLRVGPRSPTHDPAPPACQVLVPFLATGHIDRLPAVLDSISKVIESSPKQEAMAFACADGCSYLASHLVPSADQGIRQAIIAVMDGLLKGILFDPDNHDHTRWFEPLWNQLKLVKHECVWKEWLRKESHSAGVRAAIERHVGLEEQDDNPVVERGFPVNEEDASSD